MRMAESSPNGQKTLWVKEKLLVTSNFSFSHSVFKSLVRQTRKNQGLFGKGLIFAVCCTVLCVNISSEIYLDHIFKKMDIM